MPFLLIPITTTASVCHLNLPGKIDCTISKIIFSAFKKIQKIVHTILKIVCAINLIVCTINLRVYKINIIVWFTLPFLIYKRFTEVDFNGKWNTFLPYILNWLHYLELVATYVSTIITTTGTWAWIPPPLPP